MTLDEKKLTERWRQLKSERKSKPQRLRTLAAEFSCSQKEIQNRLMALDLWYDSNVRREEWKPASKPETPKPSLKKSLSEFSEQQSLVIGERYLRGKWKILKDEGYFQNFADDKLRKSNQNRAEKLVSKFESKMAVDLGLSIEEFKELLSSVEADRPAGSSKWSRLVQQLRREAEDRVEELEWEQKTSFEKSTETGKNSLFLIIILLPIALVLFYLVYVYIGAGEAQDFDDCLQSYRDGKISDPQVCRPDS